MTIKEWKIAADSTFRQVGSTHRTKRIPHPALKDAYDQGLSPVIFARDFHTLTPPLSKRRPSRFLPWGIAILVILVPAYFTHDYVRRTLGERALAQAKWPRQLPVSTPVGGYLPASAIEAQQFAHGKLREAALDPAKFRVMEEEPIVQDSAYQFRFEGEAVGKNKFGVEVQARFRILVTQDSGVLEGRSKGPLWRIGWVELDAGGDTTIWRDDNQSVRHPELRSLNRQKQRQRQSFK